MGSERFLDQRRAAGLTEDPMWFVYVLELKPDGEGITKFYVGHTCRLQRRIHDHMTGRSVEWVGRRGVASVIQCIRTTADSALGLEIAKTTELKAKHGWQHVRGGVDNNPNDSPVPQYWQAPARGLSPQRVRSRSPLRNIEGYQKNDESEGLPKYQHHDQ